LIHSFVKEKNTWIANCANLFGRTCPPSPSQQDGGQAGMSADSQDFFVQEKGKPACRGEENPKSGLFFPLPKFSFAKLRTSPLLRKSLCLR
jgi:hypothetical protein